MASTNNMIATPRRTLGPLVGMLTVCYVSLRYKHVDITKLKRQQHQASKDSRRILLAMQNSEDQVRPAEAMLLKMPDIWKRMQL